MEHKPKRHGRTIDAGHNSKAHKKTKSDPPDQAVFGQAFNEGNIARLQDRLFGIDPCGSITHKAAWQDVKTQLINIKFYFDNASTGISRIIETMDKVQKYDEERIADADNIDAETVTKRLDKNSFTK